jgi:hypothetical protein
MTPITRMSETWLPPPARMMAPSDHLQPRAAAHSPRVWLAALIRFGFASGVSERSMSLDRIVSHSPSGHMTAVQTLVIPVHAWGEEGRLFPWVRSLGVKTCDVAGHR